MLIDSDLNALNRSMIQPNFSQLGKMKCKYIRNKHEKQIKYLLDTFPSSKQIEVCMQL